MKFFRSYLLFAFIIIIHPVNGNTDYKIDHLEPPFWWTDMAENKLQLMVHGKNISKLEPQLSYPGIEIKQVHRLDNPNYLFIDLHFIICSTNIHLFFLGLHLNLLLQHGHLMPSHSNQT